VVLRRGSHEPLGRTRINAAANDNAAGYAGRFKDKDSGLQYVLQAARQGGLSGAILAALD